MLGGYGYGRVSFSTFIKRQSFGTNRWRNFEILKEILSKMIIDNKNYKPAVK
jgi:hypothetical protein